MIYEARNAMLYPGEPLQDLSSVVINLVSLNDPTDIIWAATDEFVVGEKVNDTEFYTKRCNYVDDQGMGTALFAFKVKQSTPKPSVLITG